MTPASEITPELVEDCRLIIRRWIAQGRIKVAAPLPEGIAKITLAYKRVDKPLLLNAEELGRKARRFKL